MHTIYIVQYIIWGGGDICTEIIKGQVEYGILTVISSMTKQIFAEYALQYYTHVLLKYIIVLCMLLHYIY